VENSLRNNLLVSKYNPNDKFENLYYIIIQLESIHKLELIHAFMEDLHSGNLLCSYSYTRYMISDLDYVDQLNQSNTKNDVYGV
jgi:hypothetical protein